MKKIIFGLLTFLIPASVHADVITSGVGLLLPTTGVYDRSGRASSDKLNENFRIIAATFTNQGNAINSLGISTGNLSTTLIQTTATVSALTISTQAIWANLYGGIGSTNTKANEIPTFTGVNNSTSNLNTRVLNVANSTGITVNGVLITSVVYVGATTAFNGATVTVTISAGAQTSSTSSVKYNLVITTNGSNTNQVVVSADAIDIMGCFYQSYSTTAGLNISGAGGSNLGDPASTWHRIFAISNAGCTQSGILVDSGNVTTPAMPSGFTKWRPIGWIYNDGSSNIKPIYKHGNKVSFWTSIFEVQGVNPANTATTVDLTNDASPGAENAFCSIIALKSSASGSQLVVSVWPFSMNATSPGVGFQAGQGDDAYMGGLHATGASAENLIVYQTIVVPFFGTRKLNYCDAPSPQDASSFYLFFGGYTEAD